MVDTKRLALLVLVPVVVILGIHLERKWREPDLSSMPPMPRAEESGLAEVNGIHMFYAIYGKGKGSPILMIHGGLGTADVWSFAIPDLSRTHEVIVADSRGHGRSTRTAAPLTYHLLAEDYVALLDRLKIDRTALVGWSDGANIGIDIAINHPERLTKLFAQAANVTPEGLVSIPDISTYRLVHDHDEEEFERLSKTPDDYPAFQRAVETMWATEPNYTTAQLNGITVPTEIVIGDHDEAIRPEHTAYIAASIPGARLVTLKDVGHMAIYEDPKGYIAAIHRFIDG